MANDVPRKNILIFGKTLTNYTKCGKKYPWQEPGAV